MEKEIKMKHLHRNKLVNDLINHIDIWHHSDLLEYTRSSLRDYYNSLNNNELIAEYENVFGIISLNED